MWYNIALFLSTIHKSVPSVAIFLPRPSLIGPLPDCAFLIGHPKLPSCPRDLRDLNSKRASLYMVWLERHVRSSPFLLPTWLFLQLGSIQVFSSFHGSTIPCKVIFWKAKAPCICCYFVAYTSALWLLLLLYSLTAVSINNTLVSYAILWCIWGV